MNTKYKEKLIEGYECWKSMKRRCLTKTHPAYKKYGAKGINLSKEWHKYNNFIKDMGKRPTEGHSIDRIDNSLGYFKENCRWATLEEQNSNRKFVIENTCHRGHKFTPENTIHTHNGISKTRRCKICLNKRLEKYRKTQ